MKTRMLTVAWRAPGEWGAADGKGYTQNRRLQQEQEPTEDASPPTSGLSSPDDSLQSSQEEAGGGMKKRTNRGVPTLAPKFPKGFPPSGPSHPANDNEARGAVLLSPPTSPPPPISQSGVGGLSRDFCAIEEQPLG